MVFLSNYKVNDKFNNLKKNIPVVKSNITKSRFIKKNPNAVKKLDNFYRVGHLNILLCKRSSYHHLFFINLVPDRQNVPQDHKDNNS